MKARIFQLLWFSACATTLFTQQKPQVELPATGSVFGHVFCADTNAPARLATVVLVPAEAIDSSKPDRQSQAAFHEEGVQTVLDGSFPIRHVAPGTYYVVASAFGYIPQLGSLASRLVGSDDSAEKPFLNSAPKIAVQSNLPVSVNITLERGAAVSGTVRFDDGSPASGLRVTALIQWKKQWIPVPSNPTGFSSFSVQTDDQGNYRISGLPAEKYLLSAELHLDKTTYDEYGSGSTGTSTSSVFSLSVYSGGKMRSNDGVPFCLSPGEQRHGEDLEIPISKFHTIRGSLVAAHDGHVLNGGQIFLLFADDRSIAYSTSVAEDDDDFTFSFVPEGDYILQILGASDREREEIPNPPHTLPPIHTEMRTLRMYGPTEQPLHAGSDMSDIVVSVPDLARPKSPPRP